MATEIERKYLVKGDFEDQISLSHELKQGYLSVDHERVVRIRISDKKGFITIKGEQKGISRFEWEKEIPLEEAEELLKLSMPFVIEKTRHIVLFKNQKFEVDVFGGINRGLVIAEIELMAEDDFVELPAWIGDEVSEDRRYNNSYISRNPFHTW